MRPPAAASRFSISAVSGRLRQNLRGMWLRISAGLARAGLKVAR